MKPALKKLYAFTIDLLKDYLIDKAIGTFLVSALVFTASFTVVKGYTIGQPSPPDIAVTIVKIFEVLAVASFISSIITVFPAIYKIFCLSLNWLKDKLP